MVISQPLYFTDVWRIAGSLDITVMDRSRLPSKIILAELGPGRGTMMVDILRTLKIHPEFTDATEIHLIERPPIYRSVQKKTLSEFNVFWHNELPSFEESLYF